MAEVFNLHAVLYGGILVLISVWDMRCGRIPNMLCAALFLLGIWAGGSRGAGLGGALLGSLPFLAAALLRPGSLGGGDWKLMAAAGVMLGAERVPAALGIGFLLAAAAGGIRYGLGKRGKYPIGPYLCVGIAAALW